MNCTTKASINKRYHEIRVLNTTFRSPCTLCLFQWLVPTISIALKCNLFLVEENQKCELISCSFTTYWSAILHYFDILILWWSAQFGVTKEGEATPESVEVPESPMTKLTEQDAVDIKALIQAAGEDPDTIQMIAAMKEENSDEIISMRKMPEVHILNGMKQVIEETRMLEVLFKDPVKALEAMEAEGMVPPEHLEKYRKDPALLEGDTRKALYFQFVSLAVVGGFL